MGSVSLSAANDQSANTLGKVRSVAKFSRAEKGDIQYIHIYVMRCHLLLIEHHAGR